MPTTTKLRTTIKFLSRPVGHQDFLKSHRDQRARLGTSTVTRLPANIALSFFLLHPFSHQQCGRNALNGACLPGEFYFSVASESQKKKSLKHTKTYFFLFFCTLFAKNGLFATWPPFLNRWLLIHCSFSRIVTFQMINVKRVVLKLLFRPFCCIFHPRFIIGRQSHTGFFYCKGGSRLLLWQNWKKPATTTFHWLHTFVISSYRSCRE